MASSSPIPELLSAAEVVEAAFVRIFAALRPNADVAAVPGWEAMRKRCQSLREQGRQPILVATLYGPSGAGKSTLFRLLTDIPVPAGGVRRPMTYACTAAIPRNLDARQLASVLPGHALERLDTSADYERLKQPQGDGDRLFYAPYAAETLAEVALVLVDVPDFNTVAKENWQRAEAILERAEAVIFVVHRQGYSDDRTVQELARCCRLAGRLIYLITKTEEDSDAAEIWTDLLDKTLEWTREGRVQFLERRQDGRTLHEFLSDSAVYSSKIQRTGLDDIRPLREGQPQFASGLRGAAASRVILAGLLEPMQQVCEAGKTIIHEAAAVAASHRTRLNAVDLDLEKAAVQVAGNEFPSARLLEIVIEAVSGSRWWLTEKLRWPVQQIAGHVGNAAERLVEYLWPARPAVTVENRETVERRRLTEQAGILCEHWRSSYPEVARPDDLLAADRIGAVCRSFENASIPDPSSDWESAVRDSAKQWAVDNPRLAQLLANGTELFALAGAGAIVADVVTTGGLFTIAKGTTLAAALVSVKAGGAWLALVAGAEWLQRFNLDSVAKAASASWIAQRTKELQQHLRLNFAEAMFENWRTQLANLETAPVAEFQQAVEALEGIAQQIGRADE